MKSSSQFGGPARRSRVQLRGPIILAVLVIAIVALFWFLYSAGGEQPQKRVEITVPADRLGK